MTAHQFPGDESVAIYGVILAEESSAEDGKKRWSEITLYRTRSGHYVAAGAGCSDHEGETDRHWLDWAATAEDLVKALRRPDGKGGKFLPGYVRNALENAADHDPALVRALQAYDAWGR